MSSGAPKLGLETIFHFFSLLTGRALLEPNIKGWLHQLRRTTKGIAMQLKLGGIHKSD